MKDPDSNM